MFKIVVYCLMVVGVAFLSAVSPASASQEARFRFCNSDATNRVALSYASYNLSFNTTKVVGWYVVEPGRCKDVWIWTGESYTHHFVFSSGGKIVDIGPKEYSLFGFRGTGSLRSSGQSFCVDLEEAFEFTETLFSLGRSTSCQSSETLTRFSVSTYGCENCEVNFDIPALSGKQAPSGSLLNQVFKWF
jgi:hypothetical protein